jgi:HK97 family phage major capsid protein
VKNSFKIAFVAVLAVLSGFAIAGTPLVSPELLASIGIGMVPFAGEIGGDVQKMLAQLTDTAKSAKETVEQVRKAHEDLDGRVNKINDEMKAGTVDATTKAAYQAAVEKVAKHENDLDRLNKEITELAQKSANMMQQGQTKKSIGQLAAESEEAKSYRGGNAVLVEHNGPLFAKAASTSAAASAGALIEPYRVPGVMMGPETPLTVRDLFMSVSISTNAIEWVKDKLFTNNAGPQASEGAAKNESGITFEKMTSAITTLAHWIPASRQVLADAPQLQGIIDGRLRYGLKLKEDAQLMFGDGTNGNLLGLVPQATAYAPAGIPASPTKIDHLRWAFLQASKALYPADFAVLSLEDWAAIQMAKTTDGAYIFGSPTDGASPRIWGKRVVESHSLAAGNFLAGSSMAASIWDREEVTVRVAEQHADFFIKNMVAILCEERLGFTVERPAAIVSGPFPA